MITETENIIRFKRDTPFRNNLFTPESYAHPAKMDAQLLVWIVEHFTKEGNVILDPMFGSGTSMLACLFGRHVIGVELEAKFVEMAKANWAKVSCKPQLGVTLGTCQILQGDARNLTGVLADAVVTSPPYEGMLELSSRHTKGGIPGRDAKLGRTGTCASVDAVITSPPYEAAVTGSNGIDWTKATRGSKENWAPRDRTKEPSYAHLPGQGQPFNYSDTKDNIGNLKTTSYLEAMAQVYRQCHAVLRPGGLMVLVTKNFIREKKEIRLDLDTIKLCEAAGFTFQERWYRELPAQSFWRILYKRKYPDAPELNYEDVLVFSKGSS